MYKVDYKLEDVPNLIAENNRRLLAIELKLEAFQPQKTPSDLMSVSEAAEFLNLSIPTIYSKVCKGELPHSKKGKRLYFSHLELSDFVKSGKRLTISEIGENAVVKAAKAMKGDSI